ncbi:MAG: hypothetical protein FWG52_09825 [Proteobacteria bacterium]|nr:hypothetical protein [Pseudomonadota bacterium]
MARKPTNTVNTPEIVTDADTPGLPAMVDAANQLAAAQHARETATRAVAAQLGYQLPADCADPDLIQRDISANMRRSVEACLEVGRGLRVLKEACEHGNFIARLDVLGLDRHVAARFINAAVKFSNVPTSAHLVQAIGSQSKLLEMLVLDDEQIEELELTGQTGELHLDDIAKMSVKELRSALREARADDEAKSRLLADKNRKIDELTTTRSEPQLAIVNWPEEYQGFIAQVQVIRNTLKQSIANLDAVRLTVMQTLPPEAKPVAEQTAEDDLLASAIETVAIELSDTFNMAETMLGNVRLDFDRTLAAFDRALGVKE